MAMLNNQRVYIYMVGGIPTPLKNDGVRQLGWSFPKKMEKNMFETTNQIYLHNQQMICILFRSVWKDFAPTPGHWWRVFGFDPNDHSERVGIPTKVGGSPRGSPQKQGKHNKKYIATPKMTTHA